MKTVLPTEKNKPSVFLALFALDERDGWFSPALAQFLVFAVERRAGACPDNLKEKHK